MNCVHPCPPSLLLLRPNKSVVRDESTGPVRGWRLYYADETAAGTLYRLIQPTHASYRIRAG